MTLNGWPFRTPVHPHFLWEANGRAYMTGGYTKDVFAEILGMIGSGTQVAQGGGAQPRTQAGDMAGTKTGIAATADAARPDVIGLRTGATPADVRNIFKARGFGSTQKRGEYFSEHSTSLAFRFSTIGAPALQEMKYLDSIAGYRIEADGNVGRVFKAELQETHKLTVFFTPIPEQERVFSVERTVVMPDSKRTTLGAFRETLIARYGTPTHLDLKFPGQFFWSYGSNGELRSPDPNSKQSWAGCPTYKVGTNSFGESLNPYEFENALKTFKQEASGCGTTLLWITISFIGNPGARGDETLVSH